MTSHYIQNKSKAHILPGLGNPWRPGPRASECTSYNSCGSLGPATQLQFLSKPSRISRKLLPLPEQSFQIRTRPIWEISPYRKGCYFKEQPPSILHFVVFYPASFFFLVHTTDWKHYTLTYLSVLLNSSLAWMQSFWLPGIALVSRKNLGTQ